jgi:hypothetical protein
MLHPEALNPALKSLALGSEHRSQSARCNMIAKAGAYHEKSIKFAPHKHNELAKSKTTYMLQLQRFMLQL